jgi:uncharacterized protein
VAASNDRPSARRVAVYFALTFVWTWAAWWSAAAIGREFTEPLVLLLFLTGGLGPLVGAAWTIRTRDSAYRHEFVRRIWDPRRIPPRCWLALTLVSIAPALLGATVARLTGVTAAVPDYRIGPVVGVIGFALAAGLVEEPGWRGAASDAWQARSAPLVAAVGIGALWALWHLPLYFIDGTYQHDVGFGSVRFWFTSLALLLLGVLYLWLVNAAGGSILVAVLAHAGVNIVGELTPHSATRDLVAFAVLVVATVVVVAGTRGRLGFVSDVRT